MCDKIIANGAGSTFAKALVVDSTSVFVGVCFDIEAEAFVFATPAIAVSSGFSGTLSESYLKR